MKDNVKLHTITPLFGLLFASSLTISTVAVSANSRSDFASAMNRGTFNGQFVAASLTENNPPAEETAIYDGPIVYYPITAEDRRVLECIVQGESGGESLEGKMWVATCLLNAMKREGGASASFVRKQYQYAGWSENVSDDTIRAVSRVFDDGEITHDTVLWFYAPKYCTSSWHESQQFVAEIGGHRFFCPKGE